MGAGPRKKNSGYPALVQLLSELTVDVTDLAPEWLQFEWVVLLAGQGHSDYMLQASFFAGEPHQELVLT